MTIGQRILTARQEAGLSQRQLAGENITRNMLSAIEHDKARPSLDTLVYLSQMLKKPVGYFLGEDAPALEGWQSLLKARDAYDQGRYRECLELLPEIPDSQVFGREKALLTALATMALAERALTDGRGPYARRLLEQPVGEDCPYFSPALGQKLQILRRQAGLPGELAEDGTLTLRARDALKRRRYADAVRYLQAQDSRDGQWHYLMGEGLFGLKDWARAAEHYHIAEKTMPKAVRRRLQLCYAELKDYEKAYRYAIME